MDATDTAVPLISANSTWDPSTATKTGPLNDPETFTTEQTEQD